MTREHGLTREHRLIGTHAVLHDCRVSRDLGLLCRAAVLLGLLALSVVSCGGRQALFTDRQVFDAFRAEGLPLSPFGLGGSFSSATQFFSEDSTLLVSVFDSVEQADRWVDLSKRARVNRGDQWPTTRFVVKENVVVNYRKRTGKLTQERIKSALARLGSD